MVDFIKKITGGNKKAGSSCCGVEIQEVQESTSSCCGVEVEHGNDQNQTKDSCCSIESSESNTFCC